MRIPATLLLATLVASSFFAPASARAGSVYRCRDVDGSLAYQDRPCAGAQRQTRVDLAPAPPPAGSPDYAQAKPVRDDASPRSRRSAARGAGRAEAPSYECRAANGEVFYRHSACPASIADTDPARQRRSAGSSVAVSATALTRREACRRLAAAGSIGRRGRDRDERVSTYERNAGRDPCR